VPENYDPALISAIMTLPDPNNYISVYSYLPLAGGVDFTCRMPKCRYYSLTLYAGLYDPVQNRVPPSLYVRYICVIASVDSYTCISNE